MCTHVLQGCCLIKHGIQYNFVVHKLKSSSIEPDNQSGPFSKPEYLNIFLFCIHSPKDTLQSLELPIVYQQAWYPWREIIWLRTPLPGNDNSSPQVCHLRSAWQRRRLLLLLTGTTEDMRCLLSTGEPPQKHRVLCGCLCAWKEDLWLKVEDMQRQTSIRERQIFPEQQTVFSP